MGLGERIREARGDLTQAELAEKLFVDPMTVSRWERGVAKLTSRRLRQLAEVTGRPVEFFRPNGQEAA